MERTVYFGMSGLQELAVLPVTVKLGDGIEPADPILRLRHQHAGPGRSSVRGFLRFYERNVARRQSMKRADGEPGIEAEVRAFRTVDHLQPHLVFHDLCSPER